MPYEDVEVRMFASGEAGFRALARSLSRAGNGGLQLKLRQNLRREAQPVLSDLKSAVMRVQVSSTRGGMGKPQRKTFLRRRIANALRVSVAFRGVRFAVQSGLLGEGKYSTGLPRYLDSELPGYKNWRHPVFGTSAWTVQMGEPWFFVTVRAHAAQFEGACVEAVNEIIREVG